MGEPEHEATVVLRHAQEPSELMDVLRPWILCNRSRILVHRLDTLAAEHVSQVVDLRVSEMTLLDVQRQPRLPETIEHLAQICQVLIKRCGPHEDVIEVYHDVLPGHAGQNDVHQSLKCLWRRAQTERHGQPLVQSE
eukprot:46369-Eustigmatos_ZCMA.PRE.1